LRNTALPRTIALAFDLPRRPCRSAESKSVTGGKSRPALRRRLDDRQRQRMLARRSTLAARRRRSSLGEAVRRQRWSRRAALGERAGLVDDQRVDLLHPLQRLGVLDQDAGLRAAPTPTMIDIGVASPSAQGQAMISTETAATSA
jgi:hypothetical protein